jgi:hypothetical protein
VNLADLAAVYGLAGAAAAVAVYRAAPSRRGAIVGAAIALVLWPIWAPLVLTSSKRRRTSLENEESPGGATSIDPSVARVEAALGDAVEACAGTPLEGLLSAEAAARIASEMRRAAARHAEVTRALGDASLDLHRVEARIVALEAEGGSARALATARVQRDGVRRLVSLRDHDARALAEIAELVSALKTQLFFARVAGADEVTASDLVAELWARVEGLSEATPEPTDVAC